jgi:hypothetical protein
VSVCEACRQPFVPVDPDRVPRQRYCGKACRKRGTNRQARARKRVRAVIGEGRCPKPSKQPFASHEAAWAYVEARFPVEVGIAPYTCACGAVHIGHSKRREP